jgi:hypothetical protein
MKEIRNWKLEIGNWKLVIGNWHFDSLRLHLVSAPRWPMYPMIEGSKSHGTLTGTDNKIGNWKEII